VHQANRAKSGSDESDLSSSSKPIQRADRPAARKNVKLSKPAKQESTKKTGTKTRKTKPNEPPEKVLSLSVPGFGICGARTRNRGSQDHYHNGPPRTEGGHIIDEHTMNYLKGVERTPPRDLQRQLDHWFKDGWAHLTEPPNQLKVAHFFRCIPPNIGNRVYIDRYKLAANNLAAAQHWIQLNDRCNKQTGAYPALKLPYPEVSTLHTMTQ
jgi:hypothetical protein